MSITERKPKLPFWETIRRAYTELFGNLGLAARVSWAWFVVIVAITYAWNWLTYPVTTEIDPTTSTMDFLRFNALIWAGYLICVPLIASIAIAWHRKILRNEKFDGPVYLRLDRTVLAYAAIAAFFYFLTELGWSVFNFTDLMTLSGTRAALTVGLGLLLVAASFAIVGRLSILLPAIAVDDETLNLRNTCVLTSGNTWRLMWAPIVLSLPFIFILVGSILMLPESLLLSEESTGRTETAATMAVFQVLVVCFIFLEAAFLSLAYQHFTGKAVDHDTAATENEFSN